MWTIEGKPSTTQTLMLAALGTRSGCWSNHSRGSVFYHNVASSIVIFCVLGETKTGNIVLTKIPHPCFWNMLSLALECLRKISSAFAYQEITKNLVIQKKNVICACCPFFSFWNQSTEADLRQSFSLDSFTYLWTVRVLDSLLWWWASTCD